MHPRTGIFVAVLQRSFQLPLAAFPPPFHSSCRHFPLRGASSDPLLSLAASLSTSVDWTVGVCVLFRGL
eukprot:3935395-Rhodomonas_salina.3